jgi:hypothetical protein
MKLEDRERVEGTRVTIGRRALGGSGGKKVCRCYSAEYREIDGRQVCESLGTSNKSQARRKALEIQQRLESGVEAFRETNVTIGDITRRYSQTLSARGVSPKSETKYAADLSKLRTFCSEQGISLARLFTGDDLYRFHQWLFMKGRRWSRAKRPDAGAVLAVSFVVSDRRTSAPSPRQRRTGSERRKPPSKVRRAVSVSSSSFSRPCTGPGLSYAHLFICKTACLPSGPCGSRRPHDLVRCGRPIYREV